jgi:hypothetical protein
MDASIAKACSCISTWHGLETGFATDCVVQNLVFKIVVPFFNSETEKRRGAAARVESLLCEIGDSFGSEAGTKKQWPLSSDFISCGHSVFAWSIAQEIIFWSNMGQQCSEPRSR